MSVHDSTVDITCLPHRKERRFAVVAFLLLSLFGFGFTFAHLRPRSTLHSFLSTIVDDRAHDVLQAPQIVTDSAIDCATTVPYMLGNLIPPMDASCSSSLSTMSVVNLANEFQMQSSSIGIITTVAGDGRYGYAGDGGPATLATLKQPLGVAIDTVGDIYIADYYNSLIRKVTRSTGEITTVAGDGNGAFQGDNVAATSATLGNAAGVAVHVSGNIYLTDSDNHLVRKVTKSTGLITTVAGTASKGYNGDGKQATSAEINTPEGVAVDALENVYFADVNNHRIRMVTKSTGVITTVAGNGTAGYSGDNGKATLAGLNRPSGVTVDVSGNIYLTDASNHRIRMVTMSTGLITTVAGTGRPGYSGDGRQATLANLNGPSGVAVDASGNIYFGETYNNRIRLVTKSTGVITTVAGIGKPTYSGDNGLATLAALWVPQGVALDTSGRVYIADSRNNRIRMIDFATSSPSAAPTSTSAPVVAPTSTRVPSAAPTSTSAPAVVLTSTRVPSAAPTSTSAPAVAPTSTRVPSAAPTSTSAPAVAPTSTRVPSAAPTSTSAPSTAPTSTPSLPPIPASSLVATSPTTSSTSISSTVLPGVVGGVGGFLLILLVLAAICCCRRRAAQKSATENVAAKSAPSTADREMANVADRSVLKNASDILIKEGILNYVELQNLKSQGQCSSSNSWIVDGLLTDVITNTKTEVIVKLVDRDRIRKAENEFRIMNILYKDSTSNHDYFIAPLSPSLLHGSKGQIQGYGGEDCSMYIGIAMEKGIRNMRKKVKGSSNLTINGAKLEAEKLLNIIIAADQAKVVLMDFKLSNIVLVADHNGLHLKAIDFDCSCNVNDPISTDTSAFYSCPEVARWVIGGCLPSETPIASHKMDVMSYGFCVYEIATKVVYNGRSKSFWENGGVRSGKVDAHSVNMALASLTDEQVTDNLEKTFVGAHYGNLRSFLQQALRVDPEARSNGVRLLNQTSFLGSSERTLDHMGLAAQLGRIEKKVDGLSEQLRRGFDTVGTTLDTISAHVVNHLMNGDPKGIKTSKGVAALSEALKAQKGRIGEDDDALSSCIARIIEEQMSGMGDALCQDLKKSLGNVLAKSNVRDGHDQPSRDDKLDALLVMVKGMQEKMDGFRDDFKRFNEISLQHYSAASKGRNVMPSSFLLLPHVTVDVDSSASLVNKMFNRAKRLKDSVVKLGWDRVRVVFFCPVTLKIVECGPYILSSPTKELRSVVGGLKWGILLAKLILATQGLGMMLPNIADLLPDVDSDIQSGVLQSIVDDVIDEIDHSLNAGPGELSSSDLVDKVYRRIVESHSKPYGWQPADRWGMKLVRTPCGNSVWVTEGEAEKAVETCGMDAVNASRWSNKVAAP